MGYYEDLPELDINDGLEDMKLVKNAVLVDVRTPEEYMEGHVPGAINIDSVGITRQNQPVIEEMLPDKTARIFMYCHSGSRSGIASAALKLMGYRAENIGGFMDYRGPVEK